jgi:hypothetical protein
MRLPFLLCLASVAACTHVRTPALDVEAPAKDGAPTVPSERDSLVRLYHSRTSGMISPVRGTVWDARSWATVWEHLRQGGRDSLPTPAVEFSKDLVIIAALGAVKSTGYDILIDSVARTTSEFLIFVRVREPGNLCEGGPMQTEPVDVVRVPRSRLPVRFVERTEVLGC